MYFVYIFSLNAHQDPMGLPPHYPHFTDEELRPQRRLSNLIKATQYFRGREGVRYNHNMVGGIEVRVLTAPDSRNETICKSSVTVSPDSRLQPSPIPRQVILAEAPDVVEQRRAVPTVPFQNS